MHQHATGNQYLEVTDFRRISQTNMCCDNAEQLSSRGSSHVTAHRSKDVIDLLANVPRIYAEGNLICDAPAKVVRQDYESTAIANHLKDYDRTLRVYSAVCELALFILPLFVTSNELQRVPTSTSKEAIVAARRDVVRKRMLTKQTNQRKHVGCLQGDSTYCCIKCLFIIGDIDAYTVCSVNNTSSTTVRAVNRTTQNSC